MLHPCGKSTWVSYNHSTFKIKKNKSLNFKVSPQVKTIFFLPKYWGTPIISIFFLTFWFTLKNSGFCCFLLNHNTIRNLISHGWVLWVSLLIGQLQNYIHRWIQQLAWVTQVAGSKSLQQLWWWFVGSTNVRPFYILVRHRGFPPHPPRTSRG